MTGALIVAAGTGESKIPPKPMQKVGMISSLQHLILTFQQARVNTILVVTEKEKLSGLQKHVAKMGVICLGVEGAAERMEFIKEGVRFLQKRCSQILITPVNISMFSAKTVKELLKSGAEIASPVFENCVGHPVLLSEKWFSALCSYQGEEGLRGALRTIPAKRKLVAVKDQGIIWNLSKEEEYEKMQNSLKQWPIHSSLRLQLVRETAFFGPGAAQLLELIDSSQSVRMASELMGISYTKAWNILKKVESGAGFPVVLCQQGGKTGGKAQLTPQGREVLEKYQAFEEASREAVQKIFDKIFYDTNCF